MLTWLRVPGRLVLEQHSITLVLLTPPRNHAEVCFRATLHHFWLILVTTATCQSLVWNNTPSLWAHFGDWASGLGPGPAWAASGLGPGPAWARPGPGLGLGRAWAWAQLGPGPGLGPGPVCIRARLVPWAQARLSLL